MRNDPDSSDDDSSSLPDCPGSGDPVTFVTASGPHTGPVRPCGCSVPPGLIAHDRDESEIDWEGG